MITKQKPNLKLKVFQLPEAEITNRFPKNASTLEKHTSFLRSDHARFWFAKHQDYFASFPAIHVTDTGPARGIMRQCYRQAKIFK